MISEGVSDKIFPRVLRINWGHLGGTTGWHTGSNIHSVTSSLVTNLEAKGFYYQQ